jgi:hypothetical protein
MYCDHHLETLKTLVVWPRGKLVHNVIGIILDNIWHVEDILIGCE